VAERYAHADQSDAALDHAGETSANGEQAIDLPREVIESIAASLVKVLVVGLGCAALLLLDKLDRLTSIQTYILHLDSKITIP
jgi:hypothetical protein